MAKVPLRIAVIGAGLKIAQMLIDQARTTPLPMAAGDVLFLHRRTCHSSLPNTSDTVRWSFDLRYHPTGQASGRQWLPECVVRSRADPASEQRDPAQWVQARVRRRGYLTMRKASPARPRLAPAPPWTMRTVSMTRTGS